MSAEKRKMDPLKKGKGSEKPLSIADIELENQVSPSENNKSSNVNHLVSSISPICPGSMIVNTNEGSIRLYIRNTLEVLAKNGSNRLGLPMPKVSCVLSLHSGGSRKIEQAKISSLANINAKESAIHEHHVCGTRERFDWCCDEGLSVLEPIIREASGWVTFELKIDGQISPQTVEGLIRIRQLAKQTGIFVMIFIVSNEGYEKSRLHELCDEYIDVMSCEPYPGYEIALALDCVGLRDMNAFGVGRVMCNIKVVNNKFYRIYEPFIA